MACTGAAIVVALAASSYRNAYRTYSSLVNGHHPYTIVEGIAESPLIANLQHHATDDHLYSNRPMGVYLKTGIQPALYIPAWVPWTSPFTEADCLDNLTSFSNRSESGKLQIAWFDSLHLDDARIYCDIPTLAAHYSELTLVEDFPDGAIYRFDPSG